MSGVSSVERPAPRRGGLALVLLAAVASFSSSLLRELGRGRYETANGLAPPEGLPPAAAIRPGDPAPPRPSTVAPQRARSPAPPHRIRRPRAPPAGADIRLDPATGADLRASDAAARQEVVPSDPLGGAPAAQTAGPTAPLDSDDAPGF